jgi:hypothetical protein
VENRWLDFNNITPLLIQDDNGAEAVGTTGNLDEHFGNSLLVIMAHPVNRI